MTNKEAMSAAIKSQIKGDKNHGWGQDDSYVVLLAIIANETGADAKELDHGEFGHLIKNLINPSAFRQALEKAGVLNETKGKREKSALKSLLSEQ